jgi:ABC-type transport system involved in multi-copper enzyme maturation permease subunit
MNVVVRKLIRKELHVNRWFVAGAAISAALSILVCAFGEAAFNIGALTWLTTVIAFGVMIALYGVMNERKEHSLQFVLSLPLSVGEYVLAKMVGLLLCYSLLWLVATGSAISLVLLAPRVPDGLLPYTVLLCIFMFANFAVVLCAALHARSEAITTAAIIVTNMAVSVFMFTVGAMPSLKAHMFGPTPVWNDTFFNVLIVELIVFAIAVTLPLATAARRRDFI